MEHQRIDKWLWSVRFFKTRTLAAAAVTGGKVRLSGNAIKPSRSIVIGDTLLIKRGAFHYTVVVTALATQRLSAKQAAEFYTETDSSIEQRKQLHQQLRLAKMLSPRPQSKPNKKARRQIRQLRRMPT